MRGYWICAVVVLAGLPASAGCDPAEASSVGTLPVRDIEFRYEVAVPSVAAGEGPVDVFLPLAHDDPSQQVLVREIAGTVPGVEKVEPVYGNHFWHGHLDKADGQPLTVSVRYRVRRSQSVATNGGLSTAERALFLKPDRLVPVGGDLVDRIRQDVHWSDPTPLGRARSIYDYVVDNMEYKKTGDGWGNGDTTWACSAKYGNCTDFHALFISLARSEGLPARFEIGFPVPSDSGGEIKGYHCWVEVWIDGQGWFPIDASEAKKDPTRRDLFFGTQPPDRVQFTVGRDLVLDEAQRTGPLNYFIYPLVEVAGRRLDGVQTNFAWRERG